MVFPGLREFLLVLNQHHFSKVILTCAFFGKRESSDCMDIHPDSPASCRIPSPLRGPTGALLRRVSTLADPLLFPRITYIPGDPQFSLLSSSDLHPARVTETLSPDPPGRPQAQSSQPGLVRVHIHGAPTESKMLSEPSSLGDEKACIQLS